MSVKYDFTAHGLSVSAPMKPFDGARLKIRRAKHHVEDARKEIQQFLSRRPYRLIVETDSDPRFQRVVLRHGECIPYDIALIIGDAVHNLRSALDHMACELVRSNGQPDDYVTFPVQGTKTKNKFNGTIKNFKARKDVIDLIRALEPYPDGAGSAIVGLHDIDIVDKHRLLVPTGRVIGRSAAAYTTIIKGSTVTLLLPTDKRILMRDRDKLTRIPAVKSLTDGDELNASFDIAFDTGTCFESEPVTQILYELSDYLAEIIEAFASLCMSGQHVRLPRPFLPRQTVTGLLKV
jgi:hypothetical protein